jgi:nucleoside-diphosphate kinase
MLEKTFAMIKPEGLVRADDIEARIIDAGLEIDARRDIILSEEQFELIYGHTRSSIPDVYDAMKSYLTSNYVRIFCVSGDDACARMLELRGSSNAADARPGSIRYDFARDQDYTVLYAEGKFAMNVFHSADADEAETMVMTFFGGRG